MTGRFGIAVWLSFLAAPVLAGGDLHLKAPSSPLSKARVHPAVPAWEPVVSLFMARGCSGCHYQKEARLALANFTTSGDERELLKSLAYRHYAVRDRVLKELGPKALAEYPRLKRPAIDPISNRGNLKPHLDLFLNNFTRDGDAVTPKEVDVMRRWFEAGAPLPQDVLDEVFHEIESYYRAVSRHEGGKAD